MNTSTYPNAQKLIQKMVINTVAAKLFVSLVGLLLLAPFSEAKQSPPKKDLYTGTIEVHRPDRRNKPQPPAVGYYWLPKDVKQIRGMIVAGQVLIEKGFCENKEIRRAAAEKGLGILYFHPHFDALFSYEERDSGQKLEKALADIAKESGHPEIEFAPILTVGHSTAGIFARNVAYWKPHRVMGVIHFKSGNFQDHIQDDKASLAGVPLLALNGEFEEYGPKGGDLKGGLRKAYASDPENPQKRNQTQWVMIRMQLLERRSRNASNFMSLVIDRGQGHTNWSSSMQKACAQFIRSVADARLPEDPPTGKEVHCRTLKPEDGWLTDADIKSPRHKPAAYSDYEGDKAKAFWHVDEAMAKTVWEIHHTEEWEYPDPTDGQPEDRRFTPPDVLMDSIDQPAEDPEETELGNE